MLAALWKQVNAVAASEIRSAVEPMFAELPSPLSSLRFTKVCLGHVPLRLENIVVHECKQNTFRENDNAHDYVQFNVDVVWDGECDIQMKADYIGSLGVKSIKLVGRMAIVLQPLLNVSPVVGAVQYAFVDTPHLELDFTGMAQVADIKSIKTTLIATILESIQSVMVLPTRSLLKVVDDGKQSFLDMHQPPLGVARLTLLYGQGFRTENRSVLRNDVRDVYCNINIVTGDVWKTSVVHNSSRPMWNEHADFIVFDEDQVIHIVAMDRDDGALDLDDFVGKAQVTLRELLLCSKNDRITGKEIKLLTMDEAETRTTITVLCELLPLITDVASLNTNLSAVSSGNRYRTVCGLIEILVARAINLSLVENEVSDSTGKPMLDTFVTASFGPTQFIATAVAEGICPTFDAEFRIPILSDMVPSSEGGIQNLPPIILSIWQNGSHSNGTDTRRLGTKTISLESLINNPTRTVSGRHTMDDSTAELEFCVVLRGIQKSCMAQIDHASHAPAPPVLPSLAKKYSDSTKKIETVNSIALDFGWGA